MIERAFKLAERGSPTFDCRCHLECISDSEARFTFEAELFAGLSMKGRAGRQAVNSLSHTAYRVSRIAYPSQYKTSTSVFGGKLVGVFLEKQDWHGLKGGRVIGVTLLKMLLQVGFVADNPIANVANDS